MQMKLEIPFQESEHANIAFNTLRVDPEPKRSGMKKTLTVQDKILHVEFNCEEARTLRVGVNSFLDHLVLVVNTIDQFGDF